MSAFYSDNGVDKLMKQFLPAFGYAVEVGASNGTLTSSAKHYEEEGWIVMCIEPNPDLEAQGRACRKLWRQIACGAEPIESSPFVIVGGYPWAAYSGFHTSDIPTSINPPDITGQTKTIQVRVETLNRVIEQAGFPRVDYLTIDAEGHELEVLRGIDLTRYHPAIIVAETWTDVFRNTVTDYLAQFGYKAIALFNTDCCYQRKG